MSQSAQQDAADRAERTGTPDTAGGPPPTPPPGRPRFGRRFSVWLVVVLILVAGLGAYGAYHVLTARPSGAGPGCTADCHTLVIWAYSGLFGGGPDPAGARQAVYGSFENATGSRVIVDYLTGDLKTAILNAKAGTEPDLVMGLDELEAPPLDEQGLLEPYAPAALSSVPASVIAAIAPDHAVTPYEYGYLGLDYNRSVDNASGHAFSQGDFLPAMASDPALASDLYYPDPLQGDITGEEFLAWEVEYYTQVLHQNWTTFWSAVKGNVHPEPDWGTCYNLFTAGAPTCLSYTSDPAAAVFYGPGGWMNTSVDRSGGAMYSWMTVYGTAIVKAGVHNLTLAQKFIDWTLGSTVQGEVPTNEWMYPANASTPLPSCFGWAPPRGAISALNDGTTPGASAQAMTGWLLQLQGIVG